MLQMLLTVLQYAGMLMALHLSGSRFPKPLSAKEETEWFRKLSGGDREARDVLISRNLRLVAHIAKKYYAADGDPDDMISTGTLGLIKAVDSFDVSKGTRFATYAARCIENEILMEFRARRRSINALRLGEPLDGDEDGELRLGDLVRDESDFVGNLEKLGQLKVLRDAVPKVLSGRPLRIISMRYGLRGYLPHTQQQTAEKLGISRSYVSRIENKALEELRQAVERGNY